ncbi:hypothetical protein RM780_05500 [Streptomyces sp. DSM 44917]|uniref:Uncharacterized protein n=1 Tax=Streptomyces boetiae TaxID=3075541 RepID=A0ABU2L4S2_9ACTN|nr:hypothetical protein [Streptomyces sp. DSM 44917]MDT0306416.1 hypothetical protein [Streptomyces sp. DSM 44917]
MSGGGVESVTHQRLVLAAPGEAAGLAAFLGRQLRWDRAAAARLRAEGDVLAVFTRPARFGVLAIRPCHLREPAGLDVTVSAGELLEGVDEAAGALGVPAPVTGPSWAGLLPRRGGWLPVADLTPEEARGAAASVVAEFRTRTEALIPAQRTRSALDALAEEIWSRTLPGTPLPLRVVHAAHALGLLAEVPPAGVTVLSGGSWLRLRTPAGSIAVRRDGPPGLAGLGVTPV